MSRRNDTLSKQLLASIDPKEEKKIKNEMLMAKMLHDCLEAKGISQKDFAKMMGKRPSEISKWLSGKHNFTIDTLSEIGFELGTDFIHYEDKKAVWCQSQIIIVEKRTAQDPQISIGTKSYINHLFFNHKNDNALWPA